MRLFKFHFSLMLLAKACIHTFAKSISILIFTSEEIRGQIVKAISLRGFYGMMVIIIANGHKFKTWTRLFAFDIVVMLFNLILATGLGEGKFCIQNIFIPLENQPGVTLTLTWSVSLIFREIDLFENYLY